MYLMVVDDTVVFATHLIRATIEPDLDLGYLFQRDADGLVCYSVEEKDNAEAALQVANIPYAVEPLSPDPAIKAKTQEIKYASRTEALAHLINDTEPESQKIPNMLKGNAALGARVKAAENALLGLMFKGVP